MRRALHLAAHYRDELVDSVFQAPQHVQECIYCAFPLSGEEFSSKITAELGGLYEVLGESFPTMVWVFAELVKFHSPLVTSIKKSASYVAGRERAESHSAGRFHTLPLGRFKPFCLWK